MISLLREFSNLVYVRRDVGEHLKLSGWVGTYFTNNLITGMHHISVDSKLT